MGENELNGWTGISRFEGFLWKGKLKDDETWPNGGG